MLEPFMEPMVEPTADITGGIGGDAGRGAGVASCRGDSGDHFAGASPGAGVVDGGSARAGRKRAPGEGLSVLGPGPVVRGPVGGAHRVGAAGLGWQRGPGA